MELAGAWIAPRSGRCDSPRHMAHPTLALGLLSVSLWMGVGCSKKENGDHGQGKDGGSEDGGVVAVQDVPLEALDLAPAGIQSTIGAPAGASAARRFLAAHVSTPDHGFAIVIERTQSTLAARKQVISGNTANKLEEYIVDDKDALLYESSVDGQPQYHVLVHKTVDGLGYECQDRKDLGFGLAQAQTMLRACRSLAGKTTAGP